MGTKLTKSRRDKKIMGVCGGIAEYLHIDSTLVRIIWAIAVCCFGSGILLYIIAGIIMPEDFGQRSSNWNGNNGYNNYNNGYNNGYNNNGYNNYNSYNADNNYSYYESENSNNGNTGSYYNSNRNTGYYSNGSSNNYNLYTDRK